MLDIRIREGVPSDGQAITEMAAKLSEHEGVPPPIFDEERFKRFGFGAEKRFDVLVAEVGLETVCGYLIFCHSFHVGLGTPGFNMLDLFVEQKLRRKGIARSLMRAMANKCIDTNGGWITWQCHPNNTLALEYYRLIGGRQFKSVDFEIAGDELIKLADNSIGRT